MSQSAELRDLVVGYQQPLLGPISLRLGAGIHILLGKNGSGKTTLMRTIAGILPPLAGTVSFIPQRQVGYLGHHAALSEGLSAEQNLRFWQRVTQLYTEPTNLESLSQEFELQELLPKRIRQLSRGQRQRTDLARIGMTRPNVLLLDEPLTGLDPLQARYVRQKMREWAENAPLIYSTHSLPEALEMSSSFLVVSRGTVKQLQTSGSHPEAELMQALEES